MYRLAILTGGSSTEREIALASAASVKNAISDKAEVEILVFPEDLKKFIDTHGQYDCAIPVFHGRGGEDGTIQGFLETLGVPYIFSGVGAHAIGMNKPATNAIVAAAGIKVPASTILRQPQPMKFLEKVVIKPIDAGSSIGVAIAHNQKELDDAITAVFETSTTAMIEQYIAGDEYSVAVIEDRGKPIALPVIAIKPKKEFFDYQSKYEDGMAEEICPALIDNALANQLQSIAVTVHQAIGAQHVTRSDYIIDGDKNAWFLEVNTIPGMSVLLPKAIKASGREFGEVLMGWVEEVIKQ